MVASGGLAQETIASDNIGNTRKSSQASSSPSSSSLLAATSTKNSSNSKESSGGSGGNRVGTATDQHLVAANSSQVASQIIGATSNEDNHKSSNKNKRKTPTTTNNSAARESSSIQDMSANANQPIGADSKESKKVGSSKTTAAAKGGEMLAKKQNNKKQTTKKNKNKGLVNKGISKDDNVDGSSDASGTNETNDVSCRRDSNKPNKVAVEPKAQKSLVDELKLFQNNQLLNQQDPIQQLHIQLSQLNRGDDEDENNVHRHHHVVSSAVRHHNHQMPAQNKQDAGNPGPPSGLQNTNHHHHDKQQQQQQSNGIGQPLGQWLNGGQQQLATVQYANEENIFTVKKGVLWQQQQYDKFHQRLFSRWKKRYFILTTDYLVCFKRSAPKVGRSEMGEFLYKTALSDVTKIERLKPKKSDKGAIVLHINGQFNLILWSKENLDEWMFMITESIERIRLRRSCQIVCQNQNKNPNSNNNAIQMTLSNELQSSNPKLKDEIQATTINDNNIINKVDGGDFYENTGNIMAPTDEQVTSSKLNHLREPETDLSHSSKPKRSSNVIDDGNKGENLSSSRNDDDDDDRKVRSQTITRHPKDKVQPTKQSPPTKQGSQEQQHSLKAPEIDCEQIDENGSTEAAASMRAEADGCLDSSSQTSTAATLSGSDRAKRSSIERERGSGSGDVDAGDCSFKRAAGRNDDETRGKGIDGDVQASGKVGGDGTKVIYDPADNDSSQSSHKPGKKTSEIGSATKLSNQTTTPSSSSSSSSAKITIDPSDDSQIISRPKNGISFKRRPELNNQISKESSTSSASSSSLSERGKSDRLHSDDDESLERPEQIKPVARKRSMDKQGIEMKSSSNSVRPLPFQQQTTVTGSPNNHGRQNEINSNNGKTDKKCNSSRPVPGDGGESPRGEKQQQQQEAVCDASSMEVAGTNTTTGDTNSFQVKPAANLPESSSRMANRPLPTPTTNLIRRDDSWQSLVSLTCAGKATPVAMQVAQRSLYAQHIMPQAADLARYNKQSQQHQDSYAQNGSPSSGSRRQQINIESTITPCRGPFLRQQSAQSSIQGDRFRPLPPPIAGGVNSLAGKRLASASFDLTTSATSTNSPIHPTNQTNNNNNNNTTSYQQKLLQLQLLHNSNNVDYIRHNNNTNQGGGDLAGDYQIYGPESTNYGYGYGYGYGAGAYGYSSMRSNLKSAASEFSFIRPSSSSQTQSTLPHPHHSNNNPPQFVLDNQITRHQLAPNQRSSLILAPNINIQKISNNSNINQTNSGYIQQSDSNNNDSSANCMSPMAKQFLVNPLTGDRIINQQLVGLNGGLVVGPEQLRPSSSGGRETQMLAPVRELPLKPNKKRSTLNDRDGQAASAANNKNTNDLPKSSSLTSIIACFFRRAFSRRGSKKKSHGSKRRSKLAESCSSSLGAFEDGCYANAPMVASAFSTGSKSVDGAGRNNNNNNNNINNNSNSKQSPRMIDMIEAFANKTHANEMPETLLLGTRLAPVHKHDTDAGNTQRPQYSNNVFKARGSSEFGTPKLMAANQRQQQQPPPAARSNNLNQFGSPLHKSNSISATMGLSFAHDTQLTSGRNYDNNNNHAPSFLYDNAMMAASGGSPMLMRSNKVLSANLTSLALEQRQQQQQPNNEFGLDHQSFLSPRNSNRRSEHLPRPSSIYGQPSMISSPIISDRMGGNFGIHRNSLHNHPHFRDRSQPPGGSGGGGSSSGFPDVRRHHQMIKVPFLDTTREVAEELSSPVAESAKLLTDYGVATATSMDMMTSSTSHHGHHQMMAAEQSPSVQGGRSYLISASPSSGKLYHHRQAVVNPILQSPTMGTIYDNHPLLLADSSSVCGRPELSTSTSSYSHYDNHNHLLMGRNNQQQPASPSLNQQHHQQMKIIGLPASPRIHTNNHFEDPYSHRATINQSQTPSHHRLSSSSDLTVGPSMAQMGSSYMIRSSEASQMGKKPSAIVAPTNQNHILQAASQQSQNHFRNDLGTSAGGGSPILDYHHHHHHHQSDRHKQQSGIEPQSRSPMLSRRAGNQNHYQQSPLVSSQTRVLNKGDGVQATVSMVGRPVDDSDSAGSRLLGGAPQPVINIAGAPGINLEPSLAASLLMGTNINAYESSTFDRLASGQSKQSNTKTFLVSTRLSKSLAYGHGVSSNETGSNTSIVKDESSVSNSTACMRSSRDELSSGSGSRSMNSSIGERSGGSSRLRGSNLGTGSSHEDTQEPDESSGSDTRADKSVIVANMNSHHRGHQQRRTSDNSNNHRASSRRKRRGDEESNGSGQQLDAINGRSDSLEKPDEKRNWITSKLVE